MIDLSISFGVGALSNRVTVKSSDYSFSLSKTFSIPFALTSIVFGCNALGLPVRGDILNTSLSVAQLKYILCGTKSQPQNSISKIKFTNHQLIFSFQCAKRANIFQSAPWFTSNTAFADIIELNSIKILNYSVVISIRNSDYIRIHKRTHLDLERHMLGLPVDLQN